MPSATDSAFLRRHQKHLWTCILYLQFARPHGLHITSDSGGKISDKEGHESGNLGLCDVKTIISSISRGSFKFYCWSPQNRLKKIWIRRTLIPQLSDSHAFTIYIHFITISGTRLLRVKHLVPLHAISLFSNSWVTLRESIFHFSSYSVRSRSIYLHLVV